MDNKTKQYQRNITERKAITYLNNMLLASERILSNLTVGDKNAHIDGYIELKEINGDDIGKLEVQVKGKNSIKSPNHPCTIDFLQYCLNQTISPVILILVDISSQKAYWMYMDKLRCQNALTDITNKNQKSTTLQFSIDNYIQNDYTQPCVDKFTKIINDHKVKIDDYDLKCKQNMELTKELIEFNKHKNISIGKTSQIYKEIHIFLDFYNNLLDNDFLALKEAIYPNYWKIGFGIYDYLDAAVRFVLYPISYELNDAQIKQFDPNDHIMQEYDNTTIIKGVVHWIENPIKTCPNQYAYQLIKESLINGIFGKLNIQLLIKDFFLATEYLFNFINNCYLNLDLTYGENTYLLSNIKEKIIKIENNFTHDLPAHIEFNKENFHIGNHTNSFHVDIVKQLIQYLMDLNINEINRVNYFNILNMELIDIIKIRKEFYDKVLGIYDLLVKTHFPNLVNELKFFNNFNLLIITFDSSPRHKIITGVELGEQHYYLQSSSSVSNKILVFPNMDNCPIKPNTFNFHDLIEIDGIQYKIKIAHGIFLDQCEHAPLMTFAHNLLKKRLTSYLDIKRMVTNAFNSDTIYD